jgi:sugar/nucleoside kinase (ribokinase family)
VLQLGSDTAAAIVRRPGGSAATVALTAARLGLRSRFIGQVGDDAVGAALVERLAAAGVDTAVRRRGVTGTVVVLLHPDGERSMVTDRGAASQLDEPSARWLDGLDALHVPLYSLAADPLATTTVTLARWARRRGLPVTVDLSSTTLLRQLGPDAGPAVARLHPSVVVANEAEAALAQQALGLDLGRLAEVATVVKRGPAPAVVIVGDRRREVPALDLGPVADTTGAGDAFAAGLLGALIGGEAVDGAVAAGHRAAARHLAAAAGG